jgi:hypothetical protein
MPSDTQTSSGQGLVVETFDISDSEIGPGQTGIITLNLVNHHSQSIDVQDISIYNTAELEVSKSGCTPSEFGEPREDFTQRMECSWRVNVPEEAVESFDSKTIPVKLNLEYDSQVSNSQNPVKIDFYPLDEISSTNDVEHSFSNGEVQIGIETESPIPFEGRTVTVKAQNAGPGRVDSNYTFEYFPEEVYSECNTEYEPIVDQEARFTCRIDPQTEQQQTRNLIISTSYKYVKAPTLDIEVVDS